MSLERELTFLEQYYYYETQYFKHPQYTIYGEYSSEITLPLLFKALRLLIETYPQLSLQVFKKGDKKSDLSLTYLDHYDLKSVVEVLDCSQAKLPIDELLQNLSTEAFEYFIPDKPLWGLKLIKPNKIIFHCEHILFDGVSGFNFHRALRDSLNTISYQEEKLGATENNDFSDEEILDKELFNINSKLVDKPGLKTTDVIDFGLNIRFFFETVYTLFLPNPLKKLIINIALLFKKRVPFYHNLKFDLYEPGDKIKSQKIDATKVGPTSLLHISKEDLDKLIVKCRSNDVKLTALLTSVLHVCALPFTKDKDISNLIPVDIRRYAKPDSPYKPGMKELDLGLYVSGMEFQNPSAGKLYPDSFSSLYDYKLGNSSSLSPSGFKFNWDLARDFQNKFEKSIDDSPLLFGMLTCLSVEDVVKDSTKLGHVIAFVLSNLKQMTQCKNKEGKLSEFQIVDLVFSQACSPVSGCFTFNAVSTDVSGMNITVTSYPGFEAEHKYFKDLFPTILKSILDDN